MAEQQVQQLSSDMLSFCSVGVTCHPSNRQTGMIRCTAAHKQLALCRKTPLALTIANGQGSRINAAYLQDHLISMPPEADPPQSSGGQMNFIEFILVAIEMRPGVRLG